MNRNNRKIMNDVEKIAAGLNIRQTFESLGIIRYIRCRVSPERVNQLQMADPEAVSKFPFRHPNIDNPKVAS